MYFGKKTTVDQIVKVFATVADELEALAELKSVECMTLRTELGEAEGELEKATAIKAKIEALLN